MNSKQAIGEIRKFHKFIKAFEYLEEVADELSRADQLIKERENRLSELAEEIARQDTALESLTEHAELKRAEIAAAVAACAKRCDEMQANATAKAAKIYTDAKTALDKYTDQGQEVASELRELNAVVTAKENLLDSLTANIEEARRQISVLLTGSA